MNKQLTDEMFHEALNNEDELGSIIRVHLHVEYQINEILSKLVQNTEHLKPLNLDYNGKVNLICALGVSSEYKTVLTTLGNMRNKFAHNPFYKITKVEVNNLYKTLPSSDKDILQRNYEKIKKGKEYKKLGPKDKFVLIAIIIRHIVIAINDRL